MASWHPSLTCDVIMPGLPGDPEEILPTQTEHELYTRDNILLSVLPGRLRLVQIYGSNTDEKITNGMEASSNWKSGVHASLALCLKAGQSEF